MHCGLGVWWRVSAKSCLSNKRPESRRNFSTHYSQSIISQITNNRNVIHALTCRSETYPFINTHNDMTITVRLLPAFIATLPFLSVANAQEAGLDITKIMSYFVVSQVAAEKCLNPSDDEKAKFAQNLLTVTIRTKQVIKERSPGKSDEVLAGEFYSLYSTIRKSYAESLEKAGCDSTVGKQGTNLWRANVNWTPPY